MTIPIKGKTILPVADFIELSLFSPSYPDRGRANAWLVITNKILQKRS